MNAPRETYLGDGLYASFDGYAITLRAPRQDGDHWVALEGPALAELIRFAETCGFKRKAHRAPKR
jgi:hypothetical protein